MRSEWRDGERVRSVELTSLGTDRYRVLVDGVAIEVTARSLEDGRFEISDERGVHVAEVTAEGARRFVRLGTLEFVLDAEASGGRRRAQTRAGGGLEAPMPGVVTRVMVAAGDTVKMGQPLVMLEAMKMEHVIRAPRDGRVASIAARAGEMVGGGTALVELEPDVTPAV
jgi:3-methylcrotonyl-CoA carboxylase alpha subunit